MKKEEMLDGLAQIGLNLLLFYLVLRINYPDRFALCWSIVFALVFHQLVGIKKGVIKK